MGGVTDKEIGLEQQEIHATGDKTTSKEIEG